MADLTCFKAYDIRGRVPDQLNEDIAYRIGRAFADFLGAKRVVLGHDIRLSSPALATAVASGLTDSGADVLDIGCCGTEEIYFAAFNNEANGVDGGIVVTASHNPSDYNGMKLVQRGSRPISGDNGLDVIRELAEKNSFAEVSSPGIISSLASRDAYIEHLLSYIDTSVLEPVRTVVNPGNGGASLVLDALEQHLPVELIKVHYDADGNFPNGVPNPLLVENRQPTAEAVVNCGACMGVAWDGDFDRCFLFDEQGQFIEGYYIVGLLANAFLEKHPDSKIVHDPRLLWNTQSIVTERGGMPVLSKTGHAFIKQCMRDNDAIYGGEMSAHHYFRDFAYCDSGMIPWLLVLELLSRSAKPLSALVADMIEQFPVSGEINRTVDDAPAIVERVHSRYVREALDTDRTDGLSMSFEGWRFNLRMSNTEPLLRLNVESRGDSALMQEKTEELLAQLL